MDAVDEDRFTDEATGLADIPRILARVEESLGRIQELAGEVPVVVLILPTSHHVDETVWSTTLIRLGLDPVNKHLNPHGHRLVARRLAETIEGLLPR